MKLISNMSGVAALNLFLSGVLGYECVQPPVTPSAALVSFPSDFGSHSGYNLECKKPDSNETRLPNALPTISLQGSSMLVTVLPTRGSTLASK